MKLTVAKYHLPSGRCPHREYDKEGRIADPNWGVTPDRVVELLENKPEDAWKNSAVYALLKKGVYDPSFAPFSVDGAKALVDLGVKLVGLDYLSAAAADEQVPVHRAFLDHGIVLLEGVDLSQVPPGRYELFCPPVKLAGSDGAPCRAVLRELG